MPHELHKALTDGAGAVCALVGGTCIDELLGNILRAFMADVPSTDELLNDRGAMASFSVRSDVCYSLGLLSSKDYININLIRKIRNRFAHTILALDFDDREIQGYCSTFDFSDWRHKLTGKPINTPQWNSDPRRDRPLNAPTKARSRFSWAIRLTRTRLLATCALVRQQKCLSLPVILEGNFTT